MPTQYTAKLEDKTVHNEKFTQFAFELTDPHRMEFDAGQYVSIAVDDKGNRRSYSICSRPDIDHGFELLLDVEPDGLGTNYLKSLEIGQDISLLGPMGQFVIQDNDDQALVFVATGSGIAPFMSMITDLLQVRQDPRPIILYWGLRYVNQLFWQDEFERMSEAFPNFSFYPVISKPVPEWNLSTGHVTDLLEIHEFDEKTGFYLCGNKGMIESTTQVLINRDVEKNRIYHEKFY